MSQTNNYTYNFLCSYSHSEKTLFTLQKFVYTCYEFEEFDKFFSSKK